MKMLWSKITGGVLLLFLAGGAAMGQSANCSQKLADAQARFDMGNLPDIPEALEDCILIKGFTPEENVRAHKLITLVYLYQDNQPKADEWMIRLLKADKEHKLDTLSDPKEIFFHLDKFRSKPIYRIKFHGGLNFGTPTSHVSAGTENTADPVPETYSLAIGVNGGVEVEKEFFKGLSINAGVGLVSRTFLIENFSGNFADTSIFNSDQKNVNSVTVTESQLWFETPVYLKYTHYSASNFAPYLSAGFTLGYLANASMNGIRAPEGAATVDINFSDIISDGLRRQLHFFYFGGAGVKMRMKTNFVVLDARYMRGLNNLATDKKLAGQQNQYFRVNHVDDDFTLNSFLFSVGFQLSMYNPRKIKP